MRRLLGTLSILLLAAGSSAAQCALCREAMASGASPGLVRGIRWSWLLLVLPFLLAMGGIFVALFRAFRRSPGAGASSARRDADQGGSATA